MKSLKVLVPLVLIMASVPGLSYGAETILASGSGAFLAPDEFKVDKVNREDGIYIVVSGKDGAKVFESKPLGTEEKLFRIRGEDKSLVIEDVTGDKVPDIVTAAFYGPKASGLYVFSYSKDEKTFKVIPAFFPKQDQTADQLVSDVRQKDGSDMIFQDDGTVKILGLVYSEDGSQPPAPSSYIFKFDQGKFVHQKTEPLAETK